ncbi:4-amino-4-deoxychorismate lyase [Bacillus pakistanensis]|uniref:4-amino-4-deoxychorismate lyase n=1 Tax=Rossellomorea pakistanensis TaxID=992288 RepID=A0ABS2NK23_9BACI|nr:aminodeoxychorismate lyase [Bacillus pakistanensis]MBM7588213.1 4-amino-4-deoxychorismate lyase [Bacillus pakistanensis]
MFIALNGEVITKEEAKISPFDHGFLYGLGVFETFRTYSGHPFLLNDHLDRLEESLKTLNIETEVDREEILNVIESLSYRNKLKDSYIRLNVSAGLGEIGLQVAPYFQPNWIVFQKPLPTMSPLAEKNGKILCNRRNTPETQKRLKSHHYLNNIMAKREIGNLKQTEGIFLTADDAIAEGITSNLFWVRDDCLYTPSTETGILNGVTRQYIISLAKYLGIETKIGFFPVEDLFKADEVFFTNSIQEISPVNILEDQLFPGNKGSFVKRLYEIYADHTECLWSRKLIE